MKMTEPQHSLTPPTEMVQQWRIEWCDTDESGTFADHLATRAAQWGAEAELDACCERLTLTHGQWELAADLRAARRPKPPSLKELALEEVQMACNTRDISMVNFDTIRKALEQLND